MIRVMFLFLFLAVIIFLGIKAAEKVTGKDLKKLTKISTYVIISSMLAIMLMFALVVLF
jgi:large-conductance mechanosensitive channel